MSQNIPEIVAALVVAAEPCTIGFEPPLDLRELAGELGLLPALLDMGGCLGLLKNGQVTSFLWDEPAMLRLEGDPRIRNLACFQASLRYPVLAPLVPQRPIDALTCSHCSGSGKWPGLNAKWADRIVCCCGGLGWLPG